MLLCLAHKENVYIAPKETFKYFNTLVLRPTIASAQSIYYHNLFSHPMNWIILCLAPPPLHELKPKIQ